MFGSKFRKIMGGFKFKDFFAYRRWIFYENVLKTTCWPFINFKITAEFDIKNNS